ncbi:hypothetical protein [Asanoa sp. NPDC050611]|uniref:hypothetical protein n=1 Tax=Asanoa sp. NPDC050611 TaxID=3157098 RepID=UPI0033D09594
MKTLRRTMVAGAVVAASAFVLVGLGAPANPATPERGAVITAAHRSIVHEAPSAPAATSDGPAPTSGNSRAVVSLLVHLAASSHPRADLSGRDRGDHPAGVDCTDGPDDLFPAAPVGIGGTLDPAVASPHYRQPGVPLPPGGTLPTRAPPTYA